MSPNLYSQNQMETVVNYVSSLNQGDKKEIDRLLQNDFKQYFDDFITIKSKQDNIATVDYSHELNFRSKIYHIIEDDGKVITKQINTSDTLTILKEGPFYSEYIYEFQNNQIIKITESTIEVDDSLVSHNDYIYQFQTWLQEKHNMSNSDFELTKEGARKKKKLLLEFAKTNIPDL